MGLTSSFGRQAPGGVPQPWRGHDPWFNGFVPVFPAMTLSSPFKLLFQPAPCMSHKSVVQIANFWPAGIFPK
jgi:hypothetical protein